MTQNPTSSAPRRWLVRLLITALSTISTGAARADSPRPTEPEVLELPPPPELAPPWWELELGGLAVVPIERTAVCPANRDCVMNAGVGLDMRLTWRTPDGVGWGVGYDLWVLDSASLYEVALVHAIRGHVRYVLDARSRLQPWIGASIGALLFGEPSTVATGGGLVAAGGGVHIELTSEFALVASAEAILVAMAPFRTRDGTQRGEPFGVNLLVEIALGAVIRFGALERR